MMLGFKTSLWGEISGIWLVLSQPDSTKMSYSHLYNLKSSGEWGESENSRLLNGTIFETSFALLCFVDILFEFSVSLKIDKQNWRITLTLVTLRFTFTVHRLWDFQSINWTFLNLLVFMQPMVIFEASQIHQAFGCCWKVVCLLRAQVELESA